jgi:hypothetical protein
MRNVEQEPVEATRIENPEWKKWGLSERQWGTEKRSLLLRPSHTGTAFSRIGTACGKGNAAQLKAAVVALLSIPLLANCSP